MSVIAKMISVNGLSAGAKGKNHHRNHALGAHLIVDSLAALAARLIHNGAFRPDSKSTSLSETHVLSPLIANRDAVHHVSAVAISELRKPQAEARGQK